MLRCSDEIYLNKPYLLAKERQEAFLLQKEHTCVNYEQEIAPVKEAIHKDARGRLVER